MNLSLILRITIFNYIKETASLTVNKTISYQHILYFNYKNLTIHEFRQVA